MTFGNTAAMPTSFDVVRGFYEAINDGDLDRALISVAREIEVHTRVETYQGFDVVSEMLDERLAEWDSTVEIREMLEPVPDTIVVAHHLVMHGRHTHLTVSDDLVDVLQLRNGLICRTDVYANLDEALASVGAS